MDDMPKEIKYLAQQLATPQESTQGTAGESADPKAQDAGPFGQFSLLMMGAIFLLMYFLLIRPQKKEEKRKKAMISSLQKGSKVTTTSGIIGSIASIKDNTVLINVGDNSRIEFLRSAIAEVHTKEQGLEQSKT